MGGRKDSDFGWAISQNNYNWGDLVKYVFPESPEME